MRRPVKSSDAVSFVAASMTRIWIVYSVRGDPGDKSPDHRLLSTELLSKLPLAPAAAQEIVLRDGTRVDHVVVASLRKYPFRLVGRLL